MKIYMGPYRGTWLSSYPLERWWFERQYGEKSWDIDEKNYTKWDSFVVGFCEGMQWIFNHSINKLIPKRKIKVHIDDYDVWSMDHTLALIVHPMLLKLKEQKHGSPHVDLEDVPEHLHPDPNRVKMNENGEIEEWEVDNTIHDRWSWVLDEMIHAFECEVDEDWDDQFHSGETDYNFVKNEETGLTEMQKGPRHTFEVDRENMDKAWNRRKNGLRLFGKYYHGLWD
jgi:hypothetical protein